LTRPTNLRLMYDAVTASNIPRKAQIVAGYVDTIQIPQWSAADWQLFPASIHVQIVKKAASIFGNVLDVEPGDATNAQVPGWLTQMRAAGYVPSVYTSYSNWNAVYQTVSANGLSQPPYWIADYSQNRDTWWPTLNGIDAVAWQYADIGPYDLSLVAPYWEGIDDTMTPEQAAQLQALYDSLWTTANTAYKETVYDSLNGIQVQIAALKAQIAALTPSTLAAGPYYLTEMPPAS
jgi:hypothetical protein